ncbi:hypothetical protein [Saccharothrix algeriensis]|uniref:Uncharacterized protein n=1 Tax=Saccharothrix algeriensis TaxID=173560 RepID=A0A8T8HV30_9PSEU|nr:hypothetical protein [Saccharothrix algeriensis]MBM7813548.1 hypothetical protein [Saccharothrix algeriensis]QTR02050.1 hypothetical protein J7S33_22845 [Saccharothrix algeriensis]
MTTERVKFCNTAKCLIAGKGAQVDVDAMTAITAALARAHHLLRQDMLGYLDAVERLTSEYEVEDDTVLTVARTEVPRLIAALRATVCDHRADHHGLCLGCPPTWVDGRLGRETWPCPVVDRAQGFLNDPDSIYDTVPYERR